MVFGGYIWGVLMEKYHFNEAQTKLLEECSAPLAIFQNIDNDLITLLVSQGFVELFGFENAKVALELMNSDKSQNVHPDDITRISEAINAFILDDKEFNVIYRSKIRGEYRIIHAFGKRKYPEDGVELIEIWYVDEGAYLGNDDVNDDSLTRNFSLSLFDSSLQRKTNYDSLTGLPNMTYFFELAKASRIITHENGDSCSFVFINLNGMKFYNRKYGFADGDELLKNVANILIQYFGSEKACRIGQDNFAVFALSDNLEETIKDIFGELDEVTGKRNISMRVGIYPDSMGIVETSLACDRARYACNTLRNNQVSDYVYFNDDMLEYETNRQYVIDNLDRAIEEKWIQAYYQPIVRAANGRVCDEEALARWIDPVKGMLSPAEFIPVLEDSKLIYKVDLYMVDQILEKLKSQSDRGLYVVPNSVNLSRTDFDACDMVEEITRRVDAAGIGRDKLTIEITESVVGSDFEFIKTQVERFQSLGFHVWMDDFGSGYSSLDLLQSIHFDLIKLDMRFLRQFEDNEKSRIILTELVKMAISMGTDTVTEGVETQEQVEFLRDIGCTKLQGFHYCRPIPLDSILKRYEEGSQIGFENPDESEYYEALGRINLYDMDAVLSDEDNVQDNIEGMEQYFNTLPMAIVETDNKVVKISRANQSYRDFIDKSFGQMEIDVGVKIEDLLKSPAAIFAKSVTSCAEKGGRQFIEEKMGNGMTIHSVIRRVAVNPVTGFSACAIVVLGIIKDSRSGITYTDIANSLSADYINLYYVNLETENFIEYRTDSANEALSVERHGKEFFESSRKDALEFIYKDDIERFIATFTKDNVLKSIDKHGSFTLAYRLMIEGEPRYVNLKAIRMSNDSEHLIIGVNNVDAQMKQQETLERMQEEQIAYARITALSGNYIAIYTVDPVTERYVQYSARDGYERLGLDTVGEHFFERAKKDSVSVVHKDDIEQFLLKFTKENVMRMVKETGIFMLYYRIMLNDTPIYVSLRAAIVEEKDGPLLIVGICNIDAQVRRDEAYEENKDSRENKDNKEIVAKE
jgi:diguanylate cyclase (GGDEF)-like protein